MNADGEEQEDKLLALQGIFSSEEFVREESKAAGEIRVSVEVPADFTVALKEGGTLRQYGISFLPPLHLTFELPEDYPSSSPPSFTLVCSWLTHTQLSALCAQLAALYQATRGTVVLYSWIQFLKEDALRVLDIQSLLELPSDEHSTQNYSQTAQASDVREAEQTLQSSDQFHLPLPFAEPSQTNQEDFLNEGSVSASLLLPPSSSGPQDASPPIHPTSEDQTLSHLSLTPSQTLLSQLLIYDAAQQQRQFATTLFDCGVCYIGWLGSDCVQLLECGHVFCRTCLAQFCKLQITEGNVRGMTCPQADCTAAPTPAQVRSLVGEELFSRYDRLLLQNTLDGMPDVVYCPRRSCGSAVIQEKSSTAAMCSVCSFAFCVTCRRTYHGVDDCRRKKDMPKQTEKDAWEDSVDLPQSQEGIKALWSDYVSGSKQRKHLLESRYGRKALGHTVEGYLSEAWIASNTKRCPHCFCRIQKDSGCNMMTCSKCRQQFCWACLTRLSRPEAGTHFMDSPCSIYQY